MLPAGALGLTRRIVNGGKRLSPFTKPFAVMVCAICQASRRWCFALVQHERPHRDSIAAPVELLPPVSGLPRSPFRSLVSEPRTSCRRGVLHTDYCYLFFRPWDTSDIDEFTRKRISVALRILHVVENSSFALYFVIFTVRGAIFTVRHWCRLGLLSFTSRSLVKEAKMHVETHLLALRAATPLGRNTLQSSGSGHVEMKLPLELPLCWLRCRQNSQRSVVSIQSSNTS
jgi:hypothetical protein